MSTNNKISKGPAVIFVARTFFKQNKWTTKKKLFFKKKKCENFNSYRVIHWILFEKWDAVGHLAAHASDSSLLMLSSIDYYWVNCSMIYIDGVAVGREDMSTNNRSTMDYQSENTIKKEQKKRRISACSSFIYYFVFYWKLLISKNWANRWISESNNLTSSSSFFSKWNSVKNARHDR